MTLHAFRRLAALMRSKVPAEDAELPAFPEHPRARDQAFWHEAEARVIRDYGEACFFAGDRRSVLRFASAITTAAKVAQWIRVEDRLPELGVLVLGWDGALAVFTRDDAGEHGWLWARQTWCHNLGDPQGIECDDDYAVTHWMPLPSPPATPAKEPSE